ncbi:MAG: glycosyltransferase family 2 protein [Alphaproteobacteria bacterium]|nr:glycosyltransferase family 2 protein [Alphaproteobacteria bacterium]
MNAPTVGLALPVYNGERFLRQAIDSILDQTYTDFELIISDNASSDGTTETGREYAARDNRVIYHRRRDTCSGARNFNEAFERTRSRFFKFVAADDVCAPTYLERCVEVLERDPGVVLCHAATQAIDENDNSVAEVTYPEGAAAARPHERFRAMTEANHTSYRAVEIFGVIRVDALRNAAGPPVRPRRQDHAGGAQYDRPHRPGPRTAILQSGTFRPFGQYR